MDITENKIALVLGGGSARGLAHIGVLKVLHNAKIPIDFIVGTSIGALVGATYALGIPFDKIEEIALRIKLWHLTDFVISKIGFFEGRNLERIIDEAVESKDFKDLKIPLAVVTTDIETGQRVTLTSGSLTEAIRASCSLPGIFVPKRINGRMLVDGGLTDSVPVKVAQQMGAIFVISSDVGFCVKKEKITNILQMISQAIQIAGNELNKLQSRQADVTITPVLSSEVDQTTFDRTAYVIKQGEEAAKAALPLLQSRLKETGLFYERGQL
ncbi:MAG: patatin-like phospholipase family protein [Candidatus Omnitrophica bacterium]|nr:patatin-like phospholipase family protein [Candidatus Omnitrophota bacterium]